MTNSKLSAIISSVENIGASPSGKASDSDSDISGVRIPVPQPKREGSTSCYLLFWACGMGVRSSVQVASEFPTSALSVQLAALATRGLGSESLCPSQKKTTLSRVVFLLARGFGRRKPVQVASNIPTSAFLVQLAALATRGLSFFAEIPEGFSPRIFPTPLIFSAKCSRI